MGKTLTVTTGHVQRLLSEAVTLAGMVDGTVLTLGIDEPMIASDPTSLTLRRLERAINLSRHAAEELQDEMLRARDGWPDI